MRPRKLHSLLGRVMSLDPSVSFHFTGMDSTARLQVMLDSFSAYQILKEEVDLEIVTSGSVRGCDYDFVIVWDCSEIGAKEDHPVEVYCFGDTAKLDRAAVNEQEVRLGDAIGGGRHVGSGSIDDLKSDASSEHWQAEAKSTKGKSFSMTLAILKKITLEARQQGKQPLLHVWFRNNLTVAPDEWIIIPVDEFRRIDGAYRCDD